MAWQANARRGPEAGEQSRPAEENVPSVPVLPSPCFLCPYSLLNRLFNSKRIVCVMETLADISTERPNGWNCYAWGIVYPVLYLSCTRRDRQHPFLRFHCIQCLLLFALMMSSMYLSDKYAVKIASVAFVFLFISWLMAMVQAGRRKLFRLPVLGAIAERLASIHRP